LIADIAHSPNRFGTVIAYKERSIISHADSNRTSPDMAIRGDKAGKKVLVVAKGFAIF
jgi:hypothetical protein